MTRKWKIINSLIAWLIFFSLVQPAYGAWDTLTAEVTFTAQTGVWNTNPTPTPEMNEAQPAAASVAPQPSDTPAAAASQVSEATQPEDTAPENTTPAEDPSPEAAPTPSPAPDPSPESSIPSTQQENLPTE
ncbi:MAG: hypothetical protein EUB_00604 [Eubacterium sp.]|uniref:hypothetical protein n=1 Tax=Eubacterium sp. TaxID=142586 RepID=UPI003022BF34